MLNDEPRPEDLPDAPHRPTDLGLPPAGGATGGGSTGGGAVGGDGANTLGPQASPTNGGSTRGVTGLRASRAFPVVTTTVVLALIAVAVIAVWRLAGSDPGRSVAAPTGNGSSSNPTPTGPATGSAAPSPTASGSVSPGHVTNDWPPALAPFYTQSVSWSKCSATTKHQCATVEVPVDYTKPTGETFRLALRKVPATDPSKRVGSLLLNPGGPGGSGIEYAQLASFAFSPTVLASYDIIGFDPRGVGQSDAVTCLTDSDMGLLFADDPTPDTAAERSKLLADADAITKRCAAAGGEKALHMSTTEVARDMDVMRALVGDEKLNFFGVSYGTLLGALYADLFPAKVGRFVLDSAISPNQTDAQEMTYDIQGFESSIDAFLAWCVARSDCALGSDASAARGKLVDLLDAVEATGLRTSTTGLAEIGEGWVSFAIFMSLYSDQSWPTLNQGLAQALGGRGDILLSHAMAVVGRDSSGHFADTSYLHAMIPVRCADWPRSPSTPAARAEQDRAKAAHPLWARMTGELFDNCRTWPAPGRAPKAGPIGVGAAPILVIGNLRDPATPIGGTQQLAKDLDSGNLVTSDHDGHGTYYAGNSCVDSAVDGYLTQGIVPKPGLAC